MGVPHGPCLPFRAEMGAIAMSKKHTNKNGGDENERPLTGNGTENCNDCK